MDSISTKPCVRFVNRATLFEDIMELYGGETIAVEYPMCIKFVGEKAIDCGGVSRDMISGFWEMAYQKSFDGSCLLTPTIEPHMNAVAQLPSVGRFLSHAFLCTGFLPSRVVFPTLAGMCKTHHCVYSGSPAYRILTLISRFAITIPLSYLGMWTLAHMLQI